MAEVDAKSVSEQWLSTFGSVLSTGSTHRISSLFVPDGYLRDSLVFTWDCRTLQGLDNIQAFLSDKLAGNVFRNFRLETESAHLSPVLDESDPAHERINAFFAFETERALCRGAVTLIRVHEDEEHPVYKAISVFTTVADWKGHEELAYIGNQITADPHAQLDPTVLIVGAGQAGLQLAARLQQSGVSCLLLEKEPEVGDNWRKRYPSLKLHVPRVYCQLLYQSYPPEFPEYLPKDLVADCLEAYVLAQKLRVWTASTLSSAPSYDAATRTWSIDISKDGQHITLHPKHLVMALSTFGEGIMPDIEGQQAFKGPQIHSDHFSGGGKYENKRVLVIGAGNSASDICVDLVQRGARSVTVFQRSPTCVHSGEYIRSLINAFFPSDVPIGITDFKMDAMPSKLLIEFFRGQQKAAREYDKEMLQGLRDAGFKTWDGPSGAGYIELGLTRGAGYFFDSGFASLVSDGVVKVNADSGIIRLTEDSVVFSDGSKLEVDAIVFATGYKPIRETYKKMLGEEFVEQTPHVWDLDEEGEVRGVYRPTGQPGFWYVAGDFSSARRFSKRLALLIKAIELGYYVQ